MPGSKEDMAWDGMWTVGLSRYVLEEKSPEGWL